MKSFIRITDEELKLFEKRKRAALINCLSGYKSVNLIGTKDSKELTNLSIVSSAFHLGSSPALLGLIIRPDTVPRDTLDNIRATKLCTLNHVNQDIYKKAHQTSARFPKEQSEFSACQLTEEYLDQFHAPFVKESKLKISLKLIREIPIPENGTHFLIMSVQDIYLPREVMKEDGFLQLDKIDTLCVSGLDSYHLPQKIARLSYAKVDKEVQEID